MSDEQLPAESRATQVHLTLKQKLIGLYVLVAIGFTIYEAYFGPLSYRGFFFNFGRSLVWPFLVFPVLGKIVGSIFIVVLIVAVTAFGSRQDE